MNRNFEDLIDDLMDNFINNTPLVSTPMSTSLQNAFRLNRNVTENIHNIRRHLELSDLDDLELDSQITQRFQLEDLLITRDVDSASHVFSDVFNVDSVSRVFSDFLLDLIQPQNVQTFEDVVVTLSQEDFDKFPRDTLTEDNVQNYTNKVCNICIESYNVGETVVQLPCDHNFHLNCIQNWLCKEKVNCPICRKDTRLSK
jgi:hypothetical protein